ncbi:MAG TPA: outer membrane beta-barrel protein [Rhizomicrobium sp.]|nr:outer membrane beta-barrel protein [Rhizomicrobium sp.]
MIRFRTACAVAALVFSFAGSALAQTETAPAQSVPEVVQISDQSLFAAKGLPIGDFRLFPTLDLEAAHDDNVYRTPLGQLDDYFFVISPAVVLRSEWARHLIALRANLDQYQYDRLDHETHTNYNFAGDGRFDLLQGLTLDTTLSYDILHLPRGDPNMPIQALSPTRYTDLHAATDIAQYIGPFGVRAGGTFDRFDYSMTPLIGGGTFNNTFQNRDQYTVFVKGDYEFSPGYAVYTQVTYDDRIYQVVPDPLGFDRDSNGIRVDAGLDMQVSNLIEGNVFAGYLKQDYKAPLSTLNGIDYGAGLTWYPTGLLTVHLKALHLIEETIVANAAATNEQTVSLGADYAFRHDIVFQAGSAFANDNFAGSGRIDQVFTATVGAKYLVNEYASLRANYLYADRTSTFTGFGYRDNTVMLALGFQL